MADLQKPVRGYSDFIGRYSGGQLGLQDSNVLAPVVQMEDFLNERKNQAFQTTFTAQGQYSSIDVPIGKRWRIHFCSALFDAAAGQVASWGLIFVKNFGGAQFFGYLDPRSYGSSIALPTMNATGRYSGTGIFPNIILDGGDEIGVTVDARILGAGNMDFTFMVQYTEWSI